MEKNRATDDMRPSEPLSYRLGLPLQDYYIDRFIPPKERLIIDIVEYIKRQDIPVLTEVLDSLEVFCIFLKYPHHWKVSYLYDIDWSDSKTHPREESVFGYEEDENLGSIFDVMGVYTLCSLTQDEEKVSRYPNIHAVLDWLSRNNKDHRTKRVLAALYIASSQEGTAAKVYRSMQRSGKMEPYDHYNLGVIHLLEKGEPLTAGEYFESALKGSRRLDEARYNLGMSYLVRDDWSNAFQHFRILAEPYYVNHGGGEVSGLLSEELRLEKLYIDNSVYVLDDLGFGNTRPYPRKSSISQLVPLEYVLIQLCCNNIGVYSYRVKDNIREALDWFDAALSWEEITGLNIGGHNKRYLTEELLDIATPPPKEYKDDGFGVGKVKIIGSSRKMHDVYRAIEKVAYSNAKVLIHGETGTGKELVARAIHNRSDRKGEFITLECGAIPDQLVEIELYGHEEGAFTDAKGARKGVFEQADKGTLFLDEVEDMSLALQSKILRALESGEIKRVGSEKSIEIDVRILLATNRDMGSLIKEGSFRKDLYFRMNVIPIKLPPLRERKEDIPMLIDHFLAKFSKEMGKTGISISPGALELL